VRSNGNPGIVVSSSLGCGNRWQGYGVGTILRTGKNSSRGKKVQRENTKKDSRTKKRGEKHPKKRTNPRGFGGEVWQLDVTVTASCNKK